jgi:hypothetical protein
MLWVRPIRRYEVETLRVCTGRVAKLPHLTRQEKIEGLDLIAVLPPFIERLPEKSQAKLYRRLPKSSLGTEALSRLWN